MGAANFNNPAAAQALLSGDMANALVAATPGGIERQEAAGQQSFVASETLPKGIRGATREQLTALGFVFGQDVDDLFVQCKLPAGWTKRATAHSMHSDLLDEKGRVRAGIFYKAAFYDRRADMYLCGRFGVSSYEQVDPAATEPDAEKKVEIVDCGVSIYAIGTWKWPDYDGLTALEEEAHKWLDENKPDWRNPLAYWD